jgi:hypothetical protein
MTTLKDRVRAIRPEYVGIDGRCSVTATTWLHVT